MPINQLRENDQVISSLRSSATDGKAGLSHVPLLVRRAILEDCWRAHEIEQTGEVARFDQFVDFVTTPPLEGLGTDIQTLQRLCGDDKVALDLIDQALQRPAHIHGGDVDNSNVRPTGTTAAQALRRLRGQRADLHAQVLTGELSPHAAMVQAGFRPRTLTVPIDAERAARTLLRGFGKEECRELIGELERLLEAPETEPIQEVVF